MVAGAEAPSIVNAMFGTTEVVPDASCRARRCANRHKRRTARSL